MEQRAQQSGALRVAILPTLRAAEEPLEDPGSDASRSVGASAGARYRILAEHGRGGSGRVLEAYDEQLGRVVALKELHDRSPLGHALFMREIELTAKLQHPGVVQIIERGQWPSGAPYYVMELVSGRSLTQLLTSSEDLSARLRLLPRLSATVETIAYAHSRGIIHRDLSPSNILVGEFGKTVVIDWGLARETRSQAARVVPMSVSGDGFAETRDARLSISGKIAGTPAYMPPEQARGETVDERSDVYALGALLYALLAGHAPYPGERISEVMGALREGPPPRLDELCDAPEELIAIVDKAMAREPAQRYASAEALAEDLHRYQTGQLVTAHSYSSGALVRRWLERNRNAVAVALAAGVALLVLASWSVVRIIQARDRAQAEEQLAREAQRSSEAQRDELLLLQATSALSRDPTESLAWLRQLPLERAEAAAFADYRRLVDDALAQGVARHVLTHDGWVEDIAFVPGGGALLSASRDGTLRAFSLDTGAQRELLDGRRSVDVVAVAPGGEWIAANGGEGEVFVWAADALRPGAQRVLNGHRDRVTDLAFSPDGERLLSRSVDGQAMLWDTASGQRLVELEVGEQAVFDLRRGRALIGEAGGGPGPTLTVRRLIDGRALAHHSLPASPRALALAPDGQRVALYGADGMMWLVEVEDGRHRALGEVPTNQSAYPVAFAPSGRQLATGGDGWAVQVWDLDSGRHQLLRGHADALFDLSFSSDGALLLSASDDGTARVWDLASSNTRVLRGHRDDLSRVELSADGRFAATASKDGQVRLWPLTGASGELAHRVLRPHAGATSNLLVNADGLDSFTRDGEWRRWNLEGDSEVLRPARSGVALFPGFVSEGGELVAEFDNTTMMLSVHTLAEPDAQGWVLAGHDDEVHHVAYAVGVGLLASTDRSGGLHLWELEPAGARELLALDDACGTALSRGGDELTILRRASIERWDPHGPRLLERRELPGAISWCADTTRAYASYSADDAYLAVAISPWGLWLRERATGVERTFDVGSYVVNALRFAPDSRTLAAGVHDRSVRLWSLAAAPDGSPGERLGDHEDMVMALAFNGDEEQLASASYDGSVRLWDLSSPRKRVLRGHAGGVDNVVFSPDGRALISGARDHTVRSWGIDIGPPTDAAALRARIDAATTAVAEGGRVATPTRE